MTNIYFYILAIAFGLCWGSFLTVVIWRIDDVKSIITDKSRCTQCNKELKWYDLFPIVSYGILKGKCRYCQKNIPLLYPIVELLMGSLTLFLFIRFGFSWDFLILFFVFSLLIVTLGYDILHMMVVDIIIWLGIALALAWQIMSKGDASWIKLIATVGYGVLIGFALPLILVIISRGKWMGEGDISLGIMAGILLGYPNILIAYIIAFISGAIVGLLLITFRGRKMNDAIPFGPFLVLGSVVAFFAGNAIVTWYLNINYLI